MMVRLFIIASDRTEGIVGKDFVHAFSPKLRLDGAFYSFPEISFVLLLCILLQRLINDHLDNKHLNFVFLLILFIFIFLIVD